MRVPSLVTLALVSCAAATPALWPIDFDEAPVAQTPKPTRKAPSKTATALKPVATQQGPAGPGDWCPPFC